MLGAAPIREPAGQPCEASQLHQTSNVSGFGQLSNQTVQSSSSSAPSLLQAGRPASLATGCSPTSHIRSPYSDAQESGEPPSAGSALTVTSHDEIAEVPLSSLPVASPKAAMPGELSAASEPEPLLETTNLEESPGNLDPLSSTSEDIMFTCQSEPPTVSMPERLGRQESRLEKVHRMKVQFSASRPLFP